MIACAHTLPNGQVMLASCATSGQSIFAVKMPVNNEQASEGTVLAVRAKAIKQRSQEHLNKLKHLK